LRVSDEPRTSEEEELRARAVGGVEKYKNMQKRQQRRGGLMNGEEERIPGSWGKRSAHSMMTTERRAVGHRYNTSGQMTRCATPRLEIWARCPGCQVPRGVSSLAGLGLALSKGKPRGASPRCGCPNDALYNAAAGASAGAALD
jgi:hypothetical protein